MSRTTHHGRLAYCKWGSACAEFCGCGRRPARRQRGFGYDYNGRRPQNIGGHGKDVKRFTHRAERREGRAACRG